MSLQQIIQQRMRYEPNTTLSFYEFMQLALYHPKAGYYTRPIKKIGKEGDFFTSVSVGSIFGEVLAQCLAEMIAQLPRHEPRYLIEFGGGSGELAFQILTEFETRFPELVSDIQVIMVEKSPYHRQLQKNKLDKFDVCWFDDWESVMEMYGEINGVIYSNELLDAFPVYILEFDNLQWKEVRVGWDESTAQLVEVLDEIRSPELLEFILREQKYIPQLEGYRIEANIDAEKWLVAIEKGLRQGYVLTIDYGYLREDLYVPHRKDGTLMCYKQHHSSNKPLEDPGEKDITTHVNFSTLMELGLKQGMENLGFLSQRQLLIQSGILDKLQDHQGTDLFHGVAAKRNRAIRQLIMPGGMGDTFHTLIQAKGDVNRDLSVISPKKWF